MNTPQDRNNAVDIIGVGFQKSATSWAAHNLSLHPRVWLPSEIAYKGKEVSFFDTKNWRNGTDWYRQIMTPPETDLLSADISPGYSRTPRSRVRACKAISPGAKIFMLMRNPVSRDWSSLLMVAQRRGFDAVNASLIDLMVFYERANVSQFTTYARTLRVWREFYHDDVLALFYDDVVKSPSNVYAELCRHIGINPDDLPHWRSEVDKIVFKGPDIPIRADIAEFLRKKYTPMVENLQHLADRDLSHWLQVDEHEA